MFLAARWRLAGVFTAILVVILVITGAVVYFSTSSLIYDRVDAELADKAQDDMFLVSEERGHGPGPAPAGDKPTQTEQPEFEQGGYFYAVLDENGEVVEQSGNAKDECIASPSAAQKEGGDTYEVAYIDSETADGVTQRSILQPVSEGGETVFLQIGRSIEPEQETLEELRNILIAVVAVSILPALMGGYVLSGRVLRPIQDSVHAQRSFIADASHELRTPVAVVRTNAEILERHLQAGTIGRESDSIAVEDILSETERLGRMVGQMLTLAQADAGQAIFSPSEMSLSELAEEVTRSLRALATSKGLELGVNIAPDLNVRGDRERLREVLVTLLDNAIKYTDTGRVDVEARRSGRKVLISIADTGVGIPKDALPHITERFYRVDKSRTRETGGTGLGLAIARHIVEAHNGTLKVESTEGSGTRVTIELRLLSGETQRDTEQLPGEANPG